jgi:hypothetical protein
MKTILFLLFFIIFPKELTMSNPDYNDDWNHNDYNNYCLTLYDLENPHTHIFIKKIGAQVICEKVR